jgi:acylphosphatase
MKDRKTVHVSITGRVQGVWFRAWTMETAKSLSLSGWVRNRGDGSVEALFSGPEKSVVEMLIQCRKGPPLARVDARDFTLKDLADEENDVTSGFHLRFGR